MKILLINPPIREWAKPNVMPLGLGYLAAVLRSDGHQVEVFDINAHRLTQKEVEQKLRVMEYDVVGIGAIVTIYSYLKWLIGILKSNRPNQPVIVGGSAGTSIPKIILNNTETDVVCMGEGERTIIELCRAIEKEKPLSNVKGICFKNSEREIVQNPLRKPVSDLDSLPFPAWDLFPMDIYIENPIGAPNRNKWIDGDSGKSVIRTMNISGTRGCPYKCIYCYHDFMGMKWRHRSPEKIIEEMAMLNKTYGVEYFHFIDDEFSLNKDFVYDFCYKKKELLGDEITWGATGRVNLTTEKLIAAMVDAGCISIGYGIESGSQKMLNTMRKGVTVSQAKRAIRLSQKYLGAADCSFIIGTPGETRETIQETIDFCKDLELQPEVIFFMTPYPGTELYKMAIEQGKIKNEEDYLLSLGEQGESIRINFTEMRDDELYSVQKEMIAELDAWNKIKHPESR